MQTLVSNINYMAAAQNDLLVQTVVAERKRLLSFIRNRVATDEEAEDILQDVFYELTETIRLMKPIERVAAWLFTSCKK
jgi:DNA-directed RNA polymerase specialized sigma24 family protein